MTRDRLLRFSFPQKNTKRLAIYVSRWLVPIAIINRSRDRNVAASKRQSEEWKLAERLRARDKWNAKGTPRRDVDKRWNFSFLQFLSATDADKQRGSDND